MRKWFISLLLLTLSCATLAESHTYHCNNKPSYNTSNQVWYFYVMDEHNKTVASSQKYDPPGPMETGHFLSMFALTSGPASFLINKIKFICSYTDANNNAVDGVVIMPVKAGPWKCTHALTGDSWTCGDGKS